MLQIRPWTRAALVMAGGLSLAACVDAKGRFDEYGGRVPPPIDASNIDVPMVDMIPNIDGVWLLAVNPSVAPGSYVQMAVTWDVTSTGASGMLDGSYQPLTTFGLAPDSDQRTPVGAAIVVNDVAVDGTASFAANAVGILPGPANPASGTEYNVDIVFHGTIRSETVVCGTVTGTVGPLNVDGSTFAAIPTATPLPAPVFACPATAVDAGIDGP